MAGRHRVRSARRMSVALVSAATATATALTVGVEPPPDPAKRQAADAVDLAAAIQLLPDSGQFPDGKAYPDLTGGLGTTVYNFGQTLADQLLRAIVGGVSLTQFAQAAGIDPQSLVTTLLADIPANLVPSILTTIGTTVDLPILGSLSEVLSPAQLTLITNVLDLLGVDEVTDGTLTGVLGLLGLNLADPFNLSNLLTQDLGVNLITAGPTFTVLKLLGLDLGWVPGLPNSVAAEINNSPYLKIGLNGIVELAIDKLQQAIDDNTLDLLNLGVLNDLLGGLGLPIPLPTVPLATVVSGIIDSLGDLLTPVTGALPDVLHSRITPTVGVGLGAFAAAMAYQQVIGDLANQPGGTNYEALTGELNPLLGSLTILPLILINNPARPDGGMFSRFAPLAALLGIDTVNPKTELTGEGGLPVLNTGLHLGGANVLPILVDATYEYQPMSDFAAWPNPVTLANNLAAALLPTYMLRGLTLEGLTDQLTPQLADAVANVTAGNPLALNLYLTLNSATLPLLEPLYLVSDVLNIVGLSPLAQIPMRIANALAPALSILTDVGYGNVTRNPDGTYTRDFSNAGDEVPFLSFPNLNPLQVLGDTFTALIGGITKELGPNPTPSTPNALQTLLNAIFGGGLGGLLGTQTLTTQSVASVPDANARLLSLAAEDTAVDTASTGSEKASATSESSSDEQKPTEAGADNAAEDTTAADKAAADKAAADKEAADKAAADKADAEKAAADKAAADKEAADKAAADKADADKADADKADTDKADADKGDAGKAGADKGDGTEKKGPRHAKPDTGDSASSDAGADKAPKHAKPERGVVRDSANFSPKAGDKSEAGGGDNDKAPAADASAGEGSDSGSAAA
jgi:hypothetical protein